MKTYPKTYHIEYSETNPNYRSDNDTVIIDTDDKKEMNTLYKDLKKKFDNGEIKKVYIINPKDNEFIFPKISWKYFYRFDYELIEWFLGEGKCSEDFYDNNTKLRYLVEKRFEQWFNKKWESVIREKRKGKKKKLPNVVKYEDEESQLEYESNIKEVNDEIKRKENKW